MENAVETLVIHKAESRGHAQHGWLDTYHTFSFANYHAPDRVHFGALRELNDDRIAAGQGFGTHPHDNMEIVTIPLTGAVEHRDTTGGHGIIRVGDVQIMSAGSGLAHSEFNASKTEPLTLLQIWVFPKHRNIQPRYDQKTFDRKDRKNKLQLVVTPDGADGSLTTDQDTWFSLGSFEKGFETDYLAKGENSYGVYAFLIDGSVTINDQQMSRRDGIGFVHTDKLHIKANETSELLLIEVP